MLDGINYDNDNFEDIIAKDHRYAARGYALLMDVVDYLCMGGKHTSGDEILEEFRARTLDLFGPLSYTVLDEWGIHCCEDIGEMMLNLTEAKRIGKDDGDTPESFAGGYDFRDAFQDPYEV